jgi:hypothetical protein
MDKWKGQDNFFPYITKWFFSIEGYKHRHENTRVAYIGKFLSSCPLGHGMECV